MRDLLTAIAALVIVVLVAALAVPPLVDWRQHRDLFERALARAAGTDVATEGGLELRLLPSPRVRIEHLRLGSGAPDAASVDARFVRAEIAPASLLSGEIRFLESRIGRMEIKLPTGADGNWRVPGRLVSGAAPEHRLVVEDLAVSQLLVTTVEPATGRTDQVYAQGVRIGAQSISGPWRIEGMIGSVPFNLAAGEVGSGLATGIKLVTRGEGLPGLDVDAKLDLAPNPDGSFRPSLTGSAKLSGPPDPEPPGGPASRETQRAAPWTASATLKASGSAAELDGVTIEGGSGGSTLRLEGTGRFDFTGPRLSLVLAGRRLDLDAAMARNTALERMLHARFPNARIDLSVRFDAVTAGGEELPGLSAEGSLVGERITLDALDVTAPGPTRVTASGDAVLGAAGRIGGRVAVSSKASDRFGAYLARLGLGALPAGLLDGRPLEASADVVVADPVTSLRNLRAQLGDARLSGSLRYTAPEGGARARLDAQLLVQGLDVTRLAPPPALAEAARGLDLGLLLEARNVGYGTAERTGRIVARIASEGETLDIERLEIADLAGANATLAGRLSPDGTGRIAGRVTAARAAPLLGLVGRFWIGGLADLVPAALADKAVDLAVTAERAGLSGSGRPLVRTRLSGTAGGGSIEAEIGSADGRVQDLAATIATDRTGTWLGAPALARPSRLVLSGRRDPAGRLGATLTGDLAGLAVATPRPFTLGAGDDRLEGGEADLTAEDAAPLFAALGQPVASPLALGAHLSLAMVAGVPNLSVRGRAAGTAFEADLFGRSPGELGGYVAVDRLSLPWLASASALNAPPSLGAPWPTQRFGATPRPLFGGAVSVAARALDLGRGFVGDNAAFDLSVGPDGLAISNLKTDLAGGRITANLAITRQEGLASLIGDGAATRIPVTALFGLPFADGFLSGTLRFGGSGESAAGLVSNLGGAGTVALDGLRMAGADPGAPERAAGRALRSDDPLATARLATLAAEELGRAPLAVGAIAGTATLIGGVLRVSPLLADADVAAWQGSASLDLRSLSLDIRGSLTAKATPRNWSGPPPYLALGWAGPLARPARTLDIAPLANGLASVVLQRELDRIDTFDLDAAERARLTGRVEMDRARRAAEEAARQARLREEAERIRVDADQRAAEQRARATGGGAPVPDPRPAPAETRPPVPPTSASGG